MKRFIFSLIVLIGLAFSNVGYALPDVSTEKVASEFTDNTATSDYEVYDALDFNVVDTFGVYEMVKTQAPEVFTGDAGGTKVTLYGKYKDDAYKYLTEHKNGKNIYTSNDCYKDKQIVVSICRSNLTYKDRGETHRQKARYLTALSTSGQINSISKKWIRSI